MTLCSFHWADSCSTKHMLRLLRLKGRTTDILFIDAIGRCSALNVCPVRAGIVSLPTMTTYLITFCVYNTLYMLYISPFPFGLSASYPYSCVALSPVAKHSLILPRQNEKVPNKKYWTLIEEFTLQCASGCPESVKQWACVHHLSMKCFIAS